MNPAKLITLSRDMKQADLAAEAMTDPAEKAQTTGVSATLPGPPGYLFTGDSASPD